MQEKGFFGRLFDLSFNEFITTSIIKVLYVIFIIVSAVIALFMLGGMFASGSFGGILLGLVLAPVIFIVYVIMARVWLEVLIVIFRIAENTAKIAGVKEPPQVQ
jgi:hypothetical protein